ncbi:hypothetical protein GCM10027418_32140 [Mariniluteicoccus endophyticus]
MSTIIESQTQTPSETTAPAPRWPAWLRAVLTPVLFVVTMLVFVAIQSIPAVTAALQPKGVTSLVALTIGSCLTLATVCALVALLMRHVDRRPLREAGFVWTARSLPLLGLGLAIALVVTWATFLPGLALGQIQRVPIPTELLTPGAVAMQIYASLVMAFILQGIPEELIFRGYLMQVLRDRPVVACWASAGLFGIIHLLSTGGQQNALDHVLYLALPFGFGFAAAALALRLRSVWVAVGIHAGSHVANMTGSFLGIMAEGRFYWAVGGLLFVLVGLVVLRGTKASQVVLDR